MQVDVYHRHRQPLFVNLIHPLATSFQVKPVQLHQPVEDYSHHEFGDYEPELPKQVSVSFLRYKVWLVAPVCSFFAEIDNMLLHSGLQGNKGNEFPKQIVTPTYDSCAQNLDLRLLCAQTQSFKYGADGWIPPVFPRGNHLDAHSSPILFKYSYNIQSKQRGCLKYYSRTVFKILLHSFYCKLHYFWHGTEKYNPKLLRCWLIQRWNFGHIEVSNCGVVLTLYVHYGHRSFFLDSPGIKDTDDLCNYYKSLVALRY